MSILLFLDIRISNSCSEFETSLSRLSEAEDLLERASITAGTI